MYVCVCVCVYVCVCVLSLDYVDTESKVLVPASFSSPGTIASVSTQLKLKSTYA